MLRFSQLRGRHERISIRWTYRKPFDNPSGLGHEVSLQSFDRGYSNALSRVAYPVCDAENVRMLSGVVSKDHIHTHIEYPPSVSLSNLVKRVKGQALRLLQKEFPELSKRYCGKYLWGVGYGAWSTGNITEESVQEYLKYHTSSANDTEDFKLDEGLSVPIGTYALSVQSSLVKVIESSKNPLVFLTKERYLSREYLTGQPMGFLKR